MLIFFWQRTVSPHIIYLAESLALRGHKVHYVAQELLTEDRVALGWSLDSFKNVIVHLLKNKSMIKKFIESCDSKSIHIVQGIRGNGLTSVVRKNLFLNKHNCWILVETVYDAHLIGLVKRLVYKITALKHKNSIDGLLAIGWKTKQWFIKTGFNKKNCFEFSYFLPKTSIDYKISSLRQYEDIFTFIFVGNMIKRKNFPHIISALSQITDYDYKLVVIGSGSMERELKENAEKKIKKIDWIGKVDINLVPTYIAMADCLILPSKHDGWGVVVSEALIQGTPAICSDSCGSAELVKYSNSGGVYPMGNIFALRDVMMKQLKSGKINSLSRLKLSLWAECVTSDSGAAYLEKILRHKYENLPKPCSPWTTSYES